MLMILEIAGAILLGAVAIHEMGGIKECFGWD